MKKIILIVMIMAALTFNGCNRQIIDTKWNFTKAKIVIGNQTIDVDVKSWKDYKNDSSIQIVAQDGTVYLTDIKNVLMLGR
jgi:hypothetical protein